MIYNKLNKIQENQYPDQPNQKEKANKSHVHVKRIEEYKVVNTEGSFMSPEPANIKFSIEDSRLVFGFFLISYNLDTNGEILFKMKFNNKEIPETRHAIGNIKSYTSSGAFGEVYNSVGENQSTDLSVNYISNVPGIIKTSSEDYNFSFGAVTFAPGGVFKRFNLNKIELSKSDEFNVIQDFNLNIKNSAALPRYFMVMYTISFLVNSNISFQSRIKMNGTAEKNSNSHIGLVAEVGVHNGKVFSLPPGDNKVEIEYKYSGDSLTITDTSNNKFVQSIYAFELPEETVVHNFKLEKPLSLNTNKDWRPMGIEGKFTIGSKKTALIIYHLNILTNNKLLKARIRLNNRFNKKSVIYTEGLEYAYGQAYVVKVLKPDTYSIDIEISSLSTNTYTPELAEVNNESIFIQVILLD